MAENNDFRNASEALTALEVDIMQYSEDERTTIRAVREHLNALLDKHGACAAIAILAVNFEISVKMGQ